MALPTRVSDERSPNVPIPPERAERWSGHTTGQCPKSSHKRQVHQGAAYARATVITTWSNGQTTKSYRDIVRCDHCGHEWEQEWMPA